jgi:hypothetical protein
MATPQQVAALFQQLGARIADAHNAAKDIPVSTGSNIGLPDGVRGVAQLTVMEFTEGKKEDDKGKYYFRAAGVVVTPEFHEGIKCRGKQTSVLIPFFDTPKRQNKKSFVEHHWPAYRDLFAKFGVEQPPAQQPGESKEAASQRIQTYYAAATDILLKQKPYFEFHTWKGEKATEGPYKGQEPRVSEFWDGRCEYVPSGTAANPAAGVAPAPALPATPAAAANGTYTQPPAAATPQPASTPAAAVKVDPAQLSAWAEAADCDSSPPETDEGKAAVLELSALSQQVGITNDEAKALPDWASIAALILQRSGANGAPSAAKPVPVKGALASYGGVPGYEVTSVNAEARTVTLKGPDKKSVLGPDKKLLKVSFDQLA